MNPRTQLAVAAAGVTLLSATALHAVFIDTAWVAPVVGAVLAVLVGGELGSRLGQHLVARTVWRFVGSSLGTLFYLTAVWAHEGAVLGFIPRGHTWHLLRVLFDRAFSEVHDSPTPAPTYKALMLLTATGVAAVAIAVDQLSVKAPLIGLPLLALYSVPEWLAKDGTGWLPLALGGGGYVGLLIREGRDRTSRWGRTVTGATALGRNRSAASAMSQAGWRIGTVALGAALVVPPLIPDVGHFNLAKGGGISNSAVLHYNLTANLFGSLRSSTVLTVYSYQTSGSTGGEYLQMAASDNFGSNGFAEPVPVADPDINPLDTSTPLPLDGVGPAATTGTINTTIAIGPHLGQQQLPIPIATTQIPGLQGQWSYEQTTSTVFSQAKDATRNQRYTTLSDVINPSPRTLQASSLTSADKDSKAADLLVPPDLPAMVAAKAKAVTKGATTAYEQAVALQDWFTDPKNFDYSVVAPPAGNNYSALTSFLTTDRRGFCQQFASAMAIMARTLGIPARVAFGFTPGNLRAGTTDTYDVSNQDGHAWPELYFSGLGWLRFEPTPRSDHQTTPPAYGALTVGEIKSLNRPGTTTTVSGPAHPTAIQGPRPDPRQQANQHSGQVGKGSGGFSLPISGDALLWTIVALAILLVLASLPLLQANARRRRLRHDGDPRAIALIAWRETLRDAYDLGYFTSAADSPRETARRLAEVTLMPHSAAESLQRMARGVERARYAPLAGNPQGLLFDAATVSHAIYAVAPRRAKLRARMLPPSTTQAAAEALSRATAAVSSRVVRLTDRLVSLTNRALGRRPDHDLTTT